VKKLNRVAVLTLAFLGTSLMYGQATRTWVSGVGDDANPCSRTAPCKTFAGAISKTAAGGEIDALDPGGFGALTITKAITIDGGGGQVSSVLVSGTDGIVISAGANDVVIIRNMRINGIGSGLSGIHFLAGKSLNLENVSVSGFTQNGLDVALNQNTAAYVHVTDSAFANNTGVGIRATNAQAPAVEVGINHTTVTLDTTGVEAAAHAHVHLNNAYVEHGSAQGVLADDATSSDARMFVDNCEVSYNGAGGAVNSLAGGAISVAYSMLMNNAGPAFGVATGGINFGYANTNRLANNSSNGTWVSTPLIP